MPIMTPLNRAQLSGLTKYLPWVLTILMAALCIYMFTGTSGLKDDISQRDQEIATLKEQTPELLHEADSSQSMAIKYKDKFYIELS